MSKIRRFFSRSLTLQLAIVLTLSLIIAYGIMAGAVRIGNNYLNMVFTNDSYLTKKDQILADSLQEYINENQISKKSISKIKEWADEEKSYVTVFEDQKLLYDTYFTQDYNEEFTEADEAENYEVYTEEFTTDVITGTTVTLSDGTKLQMFFNYYGYYRYYTLVSTVSLLLAFSFCLIVFLCFIRTKVRYISRMVRGLSILEGGDLNYEIEEKGQDELSRLAYGMNQMRLSVLEKQQRETENRKANQDLVTALSHDIRTPLTSLVGYIEILQMKCYKSPEQADHYLEMAKQKAYLIKDLSDKLFEYFIVSEKTQDSYNMERISTAALIDSLLDNQLFDLTSAGFTLEHNLDSLNLKRFCRIDLEFAQRIMNNILSNIKKYADSKRTVTVTALESETDFLLSFTNCYSSDTHHVESTGIGIKTCQKIMREHNGQFDVLIGEDTFTVKISFPLMTE